MGEVSLKSEEEVLYTNKNRSNIKQHTNGEVKGYDEREKVIKEEESLNLREL